METAQCRSCYVPKNSTLCLGSYRQNVCFFKVFMTLENRCWNGSQINNPSAGDHHCTDKNWKTWSLRYVKSVGIFHWLQSSWLLRVVRVCLFHATVRCWMQETCAAFGLASEFCGHREAKPVAVEWHCLCWDFRLSPYPFAWLHPGEARTWCLKRAGCTAGVRTEQITNFWKT